MKILSFSIFSANQKDSPQKFFETSLERSSNTRGTTQIA